jgi:hypothetical protein
MQTGPPKNNVESVELRKLQCLMGMKAYGEIHFVRDMVLDLFKYTLSSCYYILQGRMAE